MRRRLLLTGALSAVLLGLLAQPGLAHVTVNPPTAAPGSFARFDFRVPNESDNPTVALEVALPEGLEAVRFEVTPGWERTVEQDGDAVQSVTWSGGEIAPGEFAEFGFSAQMPDTGAALTFPALQTYADGVVVEWTGSADAEQPAPAIELTGAAAGGDDHGAAGTAGAPGAATARANLALAVGASGVVLGLLSLLLALRRARPDDDPQPRAPAASARRVA